MAEALPFITAAISVAQFVQGVKSSKQNTAMADATTQQATANIQNEQNTLAIKQTQLTRSQEIARGKARAAAAGSGATLGSFDTLFADNDRQALMDKYMLDYDSKMTQENLRYNSAVQSQQYKSAAQSSLISGTVAAGSTLYSGYNNGVFSSSAKIPNQTFAQKNNLTYMND